MISQFISTFTSLLFLLYLLASWLEGDWDLLPPTPERSVELGWFAEDDPADNKSVFDADPPWKNSFMRETIWSDLNLELPIELPIPDEGVVGGALGWLVDDVVTGICWVVPDGGDGESVSIGTKSSSWLSFRLFPLVGVNPSHMTDRISAAFS